MEGNRREGTRREGMGKIETNTEERKDKRILKL